MASTLNEYLSQRRLARDMAMGEITSEQRDIQRAAAEFASAEFKGVVTEDAKSEKVFPIDLFKNYADLGMMAIDIPEECDGAGYGLTEKALSIIEDCRADSSVGIAFSLVSIIGDVVGTSGTAEQRLRWLPKVLCGECFPAISLTEPAHGSDLTRFDTRAVQGGGEFVVTGSKVFTTYGIEADYFVVACQTDDNGPDYLGFSTILVEADRPGVSMSDLGDKMGIRMSSSAQVNFDEVRVPQDNLVGELHAGIETLNRFFAKSRVKIASQALGVALGAFEAAERYAVKERMQNRRYIGEFPAVRGMLTRNREKIDRMWRLILRAARNYDLGGPFERAFLAAVAKRWCSAWGEEVVRDALQIFGGYGYMREGNPADVERRLRDIIITTIYEGTNQIMDAIIRSHLRREPFDRHLIYW